jgi:4-amino-4-deoxy-L-arabinose transferase-like glycosyltransferase
VAAFYLPRLADSPVRGEEPRRARVTIEMMESGDWIVPREQGDPFLSRPPFQNWVLAGSISAFGHHGPVAIRLPSVLCVLASAWLIYGYSRGGLGRAGAFTAALAYPTFGEMFQTGRQAETEALYIFLVSTSLIAWHWGYTRGWNRLLTWVLVYALAGCAALTKGGLQPPVYLLGSIGAYLFFTRRLGVLFTPSHLVGLAVGTAVVGSWLLACADREGWLITMGIWSADTTTRFQGWQFGEVARHLVGFPPEVFGCLLPWSPALAAYLFPAFRRSLGNAGPIALYCGLAAGLAFLTIWIPPQGATRYYAPLYPCLAVLVGIVADRAAAGALPLTVARFGRAYLTMTGILFALGAVLMPFAPAIARAVHRPEFAPDPIHAWFYAVGLGLAAVVLLGLRRTTRDHQVRRAAVALALGTAVVAAGVMVDVRMQRADDTAAAVARVAREIPPDAELISLGHVDALFAYYYEKPIPARPLPPRPEDVPPGRYFCFLNYGPVRPTLPFPWVEVGSVPMDRFRQEIPLQVMVIGRRLP